ncbi:hypothetical protein UJ101_00302 [Flavobacteriaceae bacterium UJ101]|nr:hypothetical protein UJ101_00302 [Flavobacteriaceae bacterium UJ101]
MKYFNFIYIIGTIFFTVIGQLLIKYKMGNFEGFPENQSLMEKGWSVIYLLLNPFIFFGFISAFIASFFWMAAMNKFEISFAYPFMSLSFILVFIFSIFLFGETFTWGKVIGLILIILALFITVKY